VPKKYLITYFAIFLLILSALSLSKHANNKIRGGSVGMLAPLWEKLLSLKHAVLYPSQPSPFTSMSEGEQKKQIELENHLLKIELAYLQKEFEQFTLFSSKTQGIPKELKETLTWGPERKKRLQDAIEQTNINLRNIPARVIYRLPDQLNHSLWINVGSFHNLPNQPPIVELNSPVVSGIALIGIIDHVGNYQSRVRLLTDPHLNPSVRAARGGEQEAWMATLVENMLSQMQRRKNLLASEEQNKLTHLLQELKKNLDPFKKTWYLAKGELTGKASTRFNRKIILKGTGFNYDFSDNEGDSRDLRSGKSLENPEESSIPLLKTDDILITTGMDGIFPPGYQVARVTKVGLLKEGDYFYNLEAEPLALGFEELSLVFVLPAWRNTEN
jgi:rod shape-determining protein MreC